MAGTNSLEIEIHNLFQEGASVEYVCDELMSKYDKSDTLSSVEIEGLAHFLITCGRFDLLKKLFLKCVKRSKLSQFPAGFLVEALEKQSLPLNEDDINLIEFVIQQQPDELTAVYSDTILSFSTLAQQTLKQMPEKFKNDRAQFKNKLIEQLNQNRVYQLIEQEEEILNQMVKYFPNDLDVGILKQAYLEKKADDILSRVVLQKKVTKGKSGSIMKDPEAISFVQDMVLHIQTLAQQVSESNPDQLYNLAILTFQFEMFDLTLEILNMAPKTVSRDWLKAEAYVESGRYLDLLKLIESIEAEGSAQADVIFGATYLKALAYRGLGQNELAIQLLEALSHSVPSYRSTEALLHEWKNL